MDILHNVLTKELITCMIKVSKFNTTYTFISILGNNMSICLKVTWTLIIIMPTCNIDTIERANQCTYPDAAKVLGGRIKQISLATSFGGNFPEID